MKSLEGVHTGASPNRGLPEIALGALEGLLGLAGGGHQAQVPGLVGVIVVVEPQPDRPPAGESG